MAPTFGDEEKALLSIVSAVSASLSLAGAVLLICILLTRFLHRRAQMERQSDRSSSIILGWLLVIAVCDALYAFFGILLIDLLGAAGVEREHGWLCALQGVGMDMFPTACNYATFWLSLHTWRTWLHVVSPIASSEHSCIRWLLDLRLQGVIMLSVSIFSGIVPLFDTSFARYEYSDTWCWIGGRYKAARQALFYGHIIAIFIVILGLYAHVLLVHARNTLRFEEPSLQGEDPSGARLAKARRVMGMARHFLRYPVGFLIIWAPGIFNRLYETSHEPLYATTLLQAITAPSQGTVRLLVAR
jgi:hypothetical protein